MDPEHPESWYPALNRSFYPGQLVDQPVGEAVPKVIEQGETSGWIGHRIMVPDGGVPVTAMLGRRPQGSRGYRRWTKAADEILAKAASGTP